MNMVRSSLRNPAVTLTLAAMLFLAGIVSLLRMPRREDPKITIRAGLAIAYYPGASAEQVEAQVTRKIEERLFRFAEVKKRKTFSTSRDGVVIVQIELEDWVQDPDLFWSKLRHDMNELKARELPPEVLGVTVDGDFGDTVARLIAISGERYGYRELKDYANRIEDALRTIPTTSKIKRYGEQREQIEVSTSLSRLSQYRVTPGRIVKALQDQNVVEYAGSFETDRGDVPMQTSGLFHEEEQVKRLMVDVSPVTGQPVYLGDFADVQRRYVDPESFVRVDGRAAVMLSVEMQDGKNIVEFGHAVSEKLAEVRRTLPPDLDLTLVANQPRVVEERISHFDREFLIAIVAVVLVTMLLLPWRVATIAAVAIPVTIAVTFAALDAVGVELHQVSIAALIVVLGMVVDDAIVIADNYVELLDQGLATAEAAWRSASDLAAPVLAATLTIIASFLPLAWLSGTTGEFIRALPITVTVSLFCSYVVAMILTPILAFWFIKTGLRAHGAAEPATHEAPRTWLARASARVRSFSALDAMERLYDAAIRVAMPRKAATLAFGLVAFIAGVVGLQFVGDKFFPSAERDQFVVDVWLPEGARLGATDAAVRKVEAVLRRTPGIVNIATMVGAGAPRFYYAISPEMATSAYAQVVVNTTSPEVTPHLVQSLARSLPAVAPEAHVMVKELMQGATSAAPIEIRVTHADLDTLKAVAARVQRVVEATAGTRDVTTDFRGDSYRVAVTVDQEAASRVGLTNAAISQHLAGGFEGATVSTFWEGSRAVDIALRLGEGERRRFDDISSTYITSEATGARIPLAQVATLTPVWEPSRIVRRNGLRTLTVRAFAAEGLLASEVLAHIQGTLDTLPLPAGTSVAYGGEYENQNETQGEMSVALVVSLLLIFLILLLQFRSVALPLVVMASIPLSVVGAVLGLLLTHNPFSFTAFLGVIGLMGLVVRNAIILVDYMNEQIAHGMPLEQAAVEAGRRRLRPIFLTTMAAAAGVLPMIISGSSMWAPLASVLAMGLITSMVFTLLVVPVLYVVVQRRRLAKASASSATTRAFAAAPVPALAGAHATAHANAHANAHVNTHAREEASARPSLQMGVVAGLLALAAIGATATPAYAQSALAAQSALGAQRAMPVVAGRVTLEQAIELALHNNAGVRAARSRADEAVRHRQGAGRTMLPSITAEFQTLKSNSTSSLLLPAGWLGNDATGPLPAEDVRLEQGGKATSYGTVTIAQPLTSLVKIRAAREMARADSRAAEAAVRDAELEVALGVEKLYYGLLVAQQQRRAATVRLAASEEALQHRLRNVATGASLEVAALEGRTAALDARQAVQAADDDIADLAAQLSEAMGATLDEHAELVPPARPDDADTTATPAALVSAAIDANADVEVATHQLRKAEQALVATRASYIPDVSVFGMEMYQDAVALLPETQFSFGIKAQWTVFDFGRRESDVAERRAARRTAEENLVRVRRQVSTQVELADRKVQRAARNAALAREVLALRREALRIKRDQAGTGLVLVSEQREAEANVARAEADWLGAEAAHRIAIAELRWIVGQGR